jgi:inorganic triphosphatase YgiF
VTTNYRDAHTAEEADKLLLSARYKRRMLDAFAALVTKRRETHVRQLAAMDAPMAMAERIEHLSPTLRVEPNPTYYLRTARAYSFLQNFLEAAIGREALAALHGLKADGERTPDLAAELDAQRELFYGMYLVSAEDIGLASSVTVEELADPAAAMQRALDWLQMYRDDPDLAVDTRVVVPIGYNMERQSMNLWGTAGVRLAKLNVSFEPGHAPQVRPLTGGEWERIEPYKLEGKTYLIAVDEFVTAERLGMNVPTREEYRALCDGAGTKEGIVEALRGR